MTDQPVATDWFRFATLPDGITHIWEPHVDPDIRCNIWHVRGRDRDLLVDSGMGLVPIAGHIAALSDKPQLCFATHSHFDHVGGHHEFAHRIMHGAEAGIMAAPSRANMGWQKYVTAEIFTALPFAGFEPDSYSVRAAPPSELIDDGDVIDLGDRSFRALHLPGHSSGGVALFETATGIFFTGDVIYDGRLIDDDAPGAVDDYVTSMERLKQIPASVVHGGHYASFGHDRMIEIADDYIAGKRKPGCPGDTRK
jgi:glyoxylase-like metal-dependent hydrolase (beta-lactamase superfamily II)